MDFIYRHLQREQRREDGDAQVYWGQWAREKEVILLSFFFYNPSNNPLLKTFAGL